MLRVRGPTGTTKNVFVRLTEDWLRQVGIRSSVNKKHRTKLATVRGPLRVSKYLFGPEETIG